MPFFRVIYGGFGSKGVPKIMEDKPDFMQTDTGPSSRPIQKVATFSVYSCDGFATSFVKSPDDAVLQFSFWMQDITPDSEDSTQHLSDVRRYNASLKTTFCTAVKLNPNTALQLAINILENLEALPNNIKDRYNIPQRMKNIQRN
jgi:hypothetical protein